MEWIKAGMQIGQAVKNVQRLRQILSVFSKYGFMDVMDRMRLGKFLPKRLKAFAEEQAEFSTPERLRKAFEELGPTFVKLGQLLSTRPDLLPDEFIEEFKKLQDSVQPLSFEIVQKVIENEFGKTAGEIYSYFDPVPLGAASIGQAHEARLKTGEKVVVKIQRPEITKIIDTDIALLAFLAGLLEKYIPETKIIGPKVIVDEFFRSLNLELNFLVEANNIKKISENMASVSEIVIPKVYLDFSTLKVLTLEKIEGIRVNDIKAMDEAGIDRKYIVALGARAFFKAVMIDGLFHGDLHAGNLFVLPGNRLGIVDFGIVGRLSEKSRDQLVNMLLSLINEDYENLCYQYAELGAVGPSVDFDSFQRDVRNALAPYMGLSLNQLNTGRMLIEATKIATRYNVKVPGDWMLVFKSILTIEGMGRSLDPSFDLLTSGKDLVKDLIKNQYSVQRLSRDFLWVAKDLAQLFQILPRQIRWMFRKFSVNDFAIEVRSPEVEELRRQLDRNGRRLSLSVLIAGLFIASSIALFHGGEQKIFDYPLISMLYFGIAGLLLLKLLFRTIK